MNKQTTVLWALAFHALSGVFVGLGSNVWLGLGAFFALWTLAAIAELNRG